MEQSLYPNVMADIAERRLILAILQTHMRNAGRPRSVRTVRLEVVICQHIYDMPSTNTCSIARQMDVSHLTLWEVPRNTVGYDMAPEVMFHWVALNNASTANKRDFIPRKTRLIRGPCLSSRPTIVIIPIGELLISSPRLGSGNGRTPRKLADQRHRPARSPIAKIRSEPAGDRTRFALVGGEQSNRSAVRWGGVEKGVGCSRLAVFAGYTKLPHPPCELLQVFRGLVSRGASTQHAWGCGGVVNRLHRAQHAWGCGGVVNRLHRAQHAWGCGGVVNRLHRAQHAWGCGGVVNRLHRAQHAWGCGGVVNRLHRAQHAWGCGGVVNRLHRAQHAWGCGGVVNRLHRAQHAWGCGGVVNRLHRAQHAWGCGGVVNRLHRAQHAWGCGGVVNRLHRAQHSWGCGGVVNRLHRAQHAWGCGGVVNRLHRAQHAWGCGGVVNRLHRAQHAWGCGGVVNRLHRAQHAWGCGGVVNRLHRAQHAWGCGGVVNRLHRAQHAWGCGGVVNRLHRAQHAWGCGGVVNRLHRAQHAWGCGGVVNRLHRAQHAWGCGGVVDRLHRAQHAWGCGGVVNRLHRAQHAWGCGGVVDRLHRAQHAWGCGGVVDRLLSPGRIGFNSQRGRPRNFRMDLPFSPIFHSGAAPYSTCFTLMRCQDLDAKGRPNLLISPKVLHNLARLKLRSKRVIRATLTRVPSAPSPLRAVQCLVELLVLMRLSALIARGGGISSEQKFNKASDNCEVTVKGL
ncbi:hypothetical protein PR048_024224 [Dryococelus australis]|uniref:Uncharacterized protein n=1 Tax=Dryococelus australis TaxID=614101 RepID=A0ABQ9GMZ9_9NEOP|nr:hypothetical protein PR048_024224 [Dryococelus australis]